MSAVSGCPRTCSRRGRVIACMGRTSFVPPLLNACDTTICLIARRVDFLTRIIWQTFRLAQLQAMAPHSTTPHATFRRLYWLGRATWSHVASAKTPHITVPSYRGANALYALSNALVAPAATTSSWWIVRGLQPMTATDDSVGRGSISRVGNTVAAGMSAYDTHQRRPETNVPANGADSHTRALSSPPAPRPLAGGVATGQSATTDQEMQVRAYIVAPKDGHLYMTFSRYQARSASHVGRAALCV